MVTLPNAAISPKTSIETPSQQSAQTTPNTETTDSTNLSSNTLPALSSTDHHALRNLSEEIDSTHHFSLPDPSRPAPRTTTGNGGR